MNENIEERLKKIQELLDNGTITKQEFLQLKTQIISSRLTSNTSQGSNGTNQSSYFYRKNTEKVNYEVNKKNKTIVILETLFQFFITFITIFVPSFIIVGISGYTPTESTYSLLSCVIGELSEIDKNWGIVILVVIIISMIGILSMGSKAYKAVESNNIDEAIKKLYAMNGSTILAALCLDIWSLLEAQAYGGVQAFWPYSLLITGIGGLGLSIYLKKSNY